MKNKIIKGFFIFSIAFFVHKFFHIVFPMGEFTGASWQDNLSWIFNGYTFLYFVIVYFIFTFWIYLNISDIQLLYACIWSTVIAIDITLFFLPGYFIQSFFSLFGEWGDLVHLIILILISIIFAYLSRLYKVDEDILIVK